MKRPEITLTKSQPRTTRPRGNGQIPATINRRFTDRGHNAPLSGIDRTGSPWRGASRVLDRPARRRANRRSWAELKARERRAAIAARALVAVDPDPTPAHGLARMNGAIDRLVQA